MFSDIQSLPNQMPAVQNRMYIASVILHSLGRAAGMYQSVDIFWGYGTASRPLATSNTYSSLTVAGTVLKSVPSVIHLQDIGKGLQQPNFPFAVVNFVSL